MTRKHVLLVDNYDSFVFNLARYIEELGHNYLVLRNDTLSLQQIEEEIKPSHILLSPGPCTPKEAGLCLDIVRYFQGIIPILGVCLGHQVIAEALGGVVTKARTPMHGKASMIRHNGAGLFQGLPHPLKVGLYHSLIVAEENLPTALEITAVSLSGEIMAIADKKQALYGVQFHPESIMTEAGYGLLTNFLQTSAPVWA